jgi:hypothetical protein
VDRVIADTGSDNLSSLKLLARLGFTACGPGSESGSLLFERKPNA